MNTDIYIYASSENKGRRIFNVYAHGKLEEEMGTDIVNVSLPIGMYSLDWHNDKAVAYWNNKPCVFHLYRNPQTFETQGVVTLCDDREAYLFGRKLVEEKPVRF